MIFFVLWLPILIASIFYLLTLQKTLNIVSPENRKIAPVKVWLMFIPLFNFVWHFILVDKIADSLKAEFSKRDLLLSESRPAYNIGLTLSILMCFLIIPVINLLIGIGVLIFWIIYWVKITEYKNMLLRNNLIANI